jgi:hypothetical protein
MASVDYAGAWMGDRGRCFRLVCTSTHGRAAHALPGAAHEGRRALAQGPVVALDACEEHYAQLKARPRL